MVQSTQQVGVWGEYAVIAEAPVEIRALAMPQSIERCFAAFSWRNWLRDATRYGIIKTDQFHAKAYSMVEMTGVGEVSNPQEIAAFRQELKDMGVEKYNGNKQQILDLIGG